MFLIPLKKSILNIRLCFRLTSNACIKYSTSLDDFTVKNETIREYSHDNENFQNLRSSLNYFDNNITEIPCIIDGIQKKSDNFQYLTCPFNHKKIICKYYLATKEMIQEAIDSSLRKRSDWEKVPINEKIAIFMKAADLTSGKYRNDLLATTMIGQGKTIFQAEIDAAGEMADFLRFNAFFAKELYKYNPISEDITKIKNHYRYRGMEGFVAAITPFNFTAIGGNLASSPTLMGNVVLWKPSTTSILSNYILYKIFEEAGIPPGVINFLPSEPSIFSNVITSSSELAGINFTGSVATFKQLWKQTANNLDIYKSYPRLVGECGGKNYHFVHFSADIDNVIINTIKSAFEYSGQKCSACSRFYVPKSLWPKIKEGLLETVKKLKVSTPLDIDTFSSAVINQAAYSRIKSYIKYAKSKYHVHGGICDNSEGYYIYPTIVEVTDHDDKLMNEEIFGPVLSVYVYPDEKLEDILDLVEKIPFGLTGSIFSNNNEFISRSSEKLKMTAGNLYINDKSTGAIVAQQPFGGARLSGTNDKAGGPHYLLKWTSPQCIKESFIPLKEFKF